MLGNDVMGFHIRYHCNNFMDTVDRALESRIDREKYQITHKGLTTAVRPFPISVDFDELNRDAGTEEVDREVERLRDKLDLGDRIVGIGLDRIDYTKGIPERFRALDRFFSRHPQYAGRMVFVQAGVPSRTQVGAYQHLNEEIDELVADINFRHGNGSWQPIVYLREHESPVTLMAMRRMAHFCIVSSLHDGMNLVAKEFVASRPDEDGVLILSPFTGASRELTDAILVNPFATDHFAQAIETALEMEPDERKRRMRRMREVVRENNIYKWAADVISELVRFEFGV
jgi:trehalose 6-phosphate synthase